MMEKKLIYTYCVLLAVQIFFLQLGVVVVTVIEMSKTVRRGIFLKGEWA